MSWPFKQASCEFECDLEPSTHFPRIRFNFDNGWTASLLVRTSRVDAMQASVACCPTGRWGEGLTEVGPTEATADEAIVWLHDVSRRSAP